jgi:hypothetical protein
MVWMRGAASPNFKKLYARIEGTKGLFYQGRYNITIHNSITKTSDI